MRLKDNRDLQKFLQDCQEVSVSAVAAASYVTVLANQLCLCPPVSACVQLSLWINEKMLTAQDMSYDEARNLHSKWLKHQAFMAELQSNKEWLDKIQKVQMSPIYPSLSALLA